MTFYVLTEDLEIGYISSACMCDECKKRGNLEITISYLDGKFMFCTSLAGILNRETVLALSSEIIEIRRIRNSILNSRNYVCMYLESILLKE